MSRLLAIALLVLPIAAHARCTLKDQQTRIDQVNTLITAYPDRAKQLSESLHQALLLDGDEICVALDRAITTNK